MRHPGDLRCPAHLQDARASFAARWQGRVLIDPLEDGHDRDMPLDGWLLLPRKGVASADSLHIPEVAPQAVAPALLVPGLLGDLVRSQVAPLSDACDELGSLGFRLDHAWVNGRRGCSANARVLRRSVLSAAERHGERIHLIGYSKGCTDALHMLAEHPDTRDAVRSLCSLAGVVQGTPLVHLAPGWARAIIRWLPWPGVAFGDGRAISDLRPAYRRQWLVDNPLPVDLRCFSIVAVPARGRVSRVLRGSHLFLSALGRRNDSQVIARDALLPQGDLLAVVNADHWAIALPIEGRHSWLTRHLVTVNDFPRTLLLRCLLEHLTVCEMVER